MITFPFLGALELEMLPILENDRNFWAGSLSRNDRM